MEETISAADANRKFSGLIREVQKGQTFVVTAHGRPVARIVPADEDDDKKDRERARKVLMERLRSQPALNAGKWTREELYDDALL